MKNLETPQEVEEALKRKRRTLKRDLIDAKIKGLLHLPEYAQSSKKQHTIAKNISDAVAPAGVLAYRAVVQGLMEGGFFEECGGGGDFDLENLMSSVLAVKMNHALDVFDEVYDLLTEKGHVSKDTAYNPHGDNYYWVLKYKVKPTKIAQRIMDEHPDDDRPDAYRRVIVGENQSPMYAYVIDDSVFGGDPDAFRIVRLKMNYDDPDVLPQLEEMEFDFHDNYEWGTRDYSKITQVMVHFDINNMSVERGWHHLPYLEYPLLNLYSCNDAYREDLGLTPQ